MKIEALDEREFIKDTVFEWPALFSPNIPDDNDYREALVSTSRTIPKGQDRRFFLLHRALDISPKLLITERNEVPSSTYMRYNCRKLESFLIFLHTDFKDTLQNVPRASRYRMHEER
jgi:hypothetical protein